MSRAVRRRAYLPFDLVEVLALGLQILEDHVGDFKASQRDELLRRVEAVRSWMEHDLRAESPDLSSELALRLLLALTRPPSRACGRRFDTSESQIRRLASHAAS